MSFTPRRMRPEPDRPSGLAPNGLAYESVWDYPRPPKVVPEPRPVLVQAGDRRLASSTRAIRVCETAGGPVVYLPLQDVTVEMLVPSGGSGSWCEWKGAASYFDVVTDDRRSARAAWIYRDPSPGFEQLTDHLSFYPALVDCFLDGEPVRPQAGGFYGGWITSEITGPIKGEPGSLGW